MRGGNDAYLPPDLKQNIYGSVIVTADGKAWMGGHYTNVGYDSVTSLINAIINWRWNYPTGKIKENRLKISQVLVSVQTKEPHIFYRDRQAILELDEILRKFTKNLEPLKIQIVNKDGEVFETNTEEMLPRPFSPGAFRMDDVMIKQLEKIIGEDNLKKLKI